MVENRALASTSVSLPVYTDLLQVKQESGSYLIQPDRAFHQGWVSWAGCVEELLQCKHAKQEDLGLPQMLVLAFLMLLCESLEHQTD